MKKKLLALILAATMVAGLAGSLFLFRTTVFNGDVQSMGYLSLGILIIDG